PRVRVLRVLPAKGREILAGLELEIGRERRRLEETFLELDFRFVVPVQLQHDVRETLEIRIDRAIDGDLRIAQRETALARIVVAELKLRRGIILRRPARVDQRAETEVHVA